MDMESESVDISSLKQAALSLPESLVPLNLERDSQAKNQFAVSRDESRLPADGNTTGTTLEPAQHAEQLDSLAHLARTVPDSQILLQTGALVHTMPLPQAPKIAEVFLKMSSPGLSPHDTQPLSPSIYDNIIVKNRSAFFSEQSKHYTNEVDKTQGTLNEGDPGHLDLLSSYHPDVLAGDDDESQVDEFSPTQTQSRLPEFPESQRFKTPATGGKKRDYDGDIITTPASPRNPLLRIVNPTPGKMMCLSQAFAATQAASSPYLNSLPQLFPSDLPSPDIELRARPVTVSSSPMLELHRNGKEPLSPYVPVKESQADREMRAQSEPADQNLEESEDDFDEVPSMVVRQRRIKEREWAAQQQLKAASSPNWPPSRMKKFISSSPDKPLDFSPRASLRGYGRRSRRLYLPGLVNEEIPTKRDIFKANESEEETDHETEIEIAVKRSSQVPSMTEEDKENIPDDTVQVPETTVRRLQQVMNGFADEESSPSDRHRSAASHRTEPNTFAVANSQTSQSGRAPPFRSSTRVVSSGEGTDFVPQSQPTVGGLGMSQEAANGDSEVQGRLGSGLDKEEKEEAIETRASTHLTDAQRSEKLNLDGDFSSTTQSCCSSLQKEVCVNGLGSSSSVATTGFQKTYALRNQTQYETAPSHLSDNTSTASKSSSKSIAPVYASHLQTKRNDMTAVLEIVSPERSSNGVVQEILADIQDSDLHGLLASQSPIRPGRHVKRRRLGYKSSVEKINTKSLPTVKNTDSPVGRLDLHRGNASTPNHDSEPEKSPEVATPPTRSSQFNTRLLRADSPAEAVVSDAAIKRQSNVRSVKPTRSVWDIQVSPPAKKSAGGLISTTSSGVLTRKQPKNRKSPDQPPSATYPNSPNYMAKVARDKLARKLNSTAPQASESLKQTIITARIDIVAPNQVWACFSGKTRAYYPARCLGISDSDVLKYRIEWEGYAPDEVDARGIRSLDLRIGDVVKINLPEFPKFSHIIRGVKNKIRPGETDFTDIYGNKTLQLAPRQRKSLPTDLDIDNVTEVPIGSIYLDSNMWGQMKDRHFQYVPPARTESESRFATPIERPSTPSTPSSRSRRIAGTISAARVVDAVGIFSNMAFALSYDDRTRKSALADMIRTNGGILLENGFHELLQTGSIELKSRCDNLGFTALLADRHSRKEKYMQALALNLPCISGMWIDSCVTKQTIVNWQPFLLPAGESLVLEGATRSRILLSMDPVTTKLNQVLESRPNILGGADVIFVMGRGKAEDKRKPYVFLTQALGAGRIERVPDAKAAKTHLKDFGFEWVFVDDRDVETTKKVLGNSARGKDEPRVVGNEFIVQSLILGGMFEE